MWLASVRPDPGHPPLQSGDAANAIANGEGLAVLQNPVGKSVHWLIPRHRAMQQLSKVSFDRSADTLPKQRQRVVFWGLAVW